jgi:hypothetical protein
MGYCRNSWKTSSPITTPAVQEVQHTAAAYIDILMTNNLVPFKSGQRRAGIEPDKEAMEREQSAAINEAHEAMQELRSKKKNSRNNIQAYFKEREPCLPGPRRRPSVFRLVSVSYCQWNEHEGSCRYDCVELTVCQIYRVPT